MCPDVPRRWLTFDLRTLLFAFVVVGALLAWFGWQIHLVRERQQTREWIASHGGMVELVNVNDALRFDVNLKALRGAHLGLSSQVLKLARQVRE